MSLFANVKIHPTAEISQDAKIGEFTVIWNQAQIRENAVIGKDCIIGKDVYIDHEVIIGDRCKIQNGVSIYKGVLIEDDVFLGPYMTFTNDLAPRAFKEDWILTETLVKRCSSIGANATIICGITIGEYAMVGAGSVVTRNVKPFALVAGNPARQIGWVCTCGNKLNFNLFCSSCSKQYHWDKEADTLKTYKV